MTDLPPGFEPGDDCDCEYCTAWRKAAKAERKRKEKIDPDVPYRFASIGGSYDDICVEKSFGYDGVYLRVGNPLYGLNISPDTARRLAKTIKAMTK